MRTLRLSLLLVLTCACPDESKEPSMTASSSNASLSFFNDLSGRLQIELSEPTENIAPNLANQKAQPTAKIVSMKLDLEVYQNEKFRPLTDEEWERIVLRDPVVRLRGEAGGPIEHRAPNGEHFTVRDLMKAIEETERQTRGNSEWFEGVDVHHVYFEGIHREEDGTWSIAWGS